MPQRTVQLTERNSQRLHEMAARTGLHIDELVNQAIERFDNLNDADEAARFNTWRAAMHTAQGIWADRDDLPDFAAIRSSMDRDFSER